MSVMFPTIYGIALNGLSPNDAKLGSAGLIFAIVGGMQISRLPCGLLAISGISFGALRRAGMDRLSALFPGSGAFAAMSRGVGEGCVSFAQFCSWQPTVGS